jgi:hypothetical protein
MNAPPIAHLLLAICLSGCASEVIRHPTEMSAPFVPAGHVVTTQPTSFTLDSGYSRAIDPGTEFLELGSIKEGRVLKPTKTTFTIEGAHMHEAYPVVRDGRLVGFYLPVEKAFSPLSNAASFPTQKRNH